MADIVLETTVKEEHIQIVLDLLDLFGDNYIDISLGGNGLGGHIGYIFEDKKDGENNIDFGERFIKEFMVNCAKLSKKYKQRELIRQAKDEIDIPLEPVDDDMIE